jgi:cyclophilin family peptidyl-prolyl cis-trans isomerase
MKKNIITVAVVIAILGGLVIVNRMEPSRNERDLLQEKIEMEQQIEKAEKAEAEAKAKAVEDARKAAAENVTEVVELASTEPIKVKFELSTGDALIELYPEWSPLGVAQFVSAVETNVFDQSRFYKVLPGYIAQFGIAGNPEQAAYWARKSITDEPVVASNERGTLTFSKTLLPNSRTTEMFISLKDNSEILDPNGFPPIGKVIEGMENFDKIYGGYTDEPDQMRIEQIGNAYLKEEYPKLDYIRKATIVK